MTPALAMISTGYYKNGKYVRTPQIGESIKQPQEHAHHRQFVRTDMYNTYRKDVIQPRIGEEPNPEFIAAYPEKSKQMFSEDQINKVKREL